MVDYSLVTDRDRELQIQVTGRLIFGGFVREGRAFLEFPGHRVIAPLLQTWGFPSHPKDIVRAPQVQQQRIRELTDLFFPRDRFVLLEDYFAVFLSFIVDESLYGIDFPDWLSQGFLREKKNMQYSMIHSGIFWMELSQLIAVYIKDAVVALGIVRQEATGLQRLWN